MHKEQGSIHSIQSTAHPRSLTWWQKARQIYVMSAKKKFDQVRCYPQHNRPIGYLGCPRGSELLCSWALCRPTTGDKQAQIYLVKNPGSYRLIRPSICALFPLRFPWLKLTWGTYTIIWCFSFENDISPTLESFIPVLTMIFRVSIRTQFSLEYPNLVQWVLRRFGCDQ